MRIACLWVALIFCCSPAFADEPTSQSAFQNSADVATASSGDVRVAPEDIASEDGEPENDAEPSSGTSTPDPASSTSVKLTVTQAVILGLVEGATEYLPVSSTGHLVIVQDLMGLRGSEEQEQAADSLTICIQIGAIFAVLLLYWNRVLQILQGMMGKDKAGLQLFRNLIIAFIPAAVIGLLAGDEIKERLYSVSVIALALFTGGVLILLESFGRPREQLNAGFEMSNMSSGQALIVGLMQCVAFWPGFSRSYATILGCRIVKLKMSAAVEFSFLLGLLTLTAATGYEGLKHGGEMIAQYGVLTPLISLVVAFFAAAVSVRFMVTSLNRFGLTPFGYYRIILAIACLWWINRS